MIPVHVFRGRRVALFGLGRSGFSAGRALMAGGAIVHAWDDGEEARDRAENEGLTLDDLYEADWSQFSALVLSPGIPLTHPEPHALVLKARAHNVEIIGDIELFCRELDHLDMPGGKSMVISVTGTNGKSTTTALITHVLNSCGYRAMSGGNIGQAILDLPPPTHRSVYVIEVSSYQIDLTPSLAPDVAVLLNITPDHLDRHGGFDNYISTKMKIFQAQSADNISVIGVDDPQTQEICTRISSQQMKQVIPVSVGNALGRGVYVINGVLYDGVVRPTKRVVDLKEASGLPGVHNWQNAAIAFAAIRGLLKDHHKLADAILSFPGLAHRMEEVGRMGSLRFINDSKATNGEAAARALAAYENIFWIAGGKSKEGGIEALKPLFSHVLKAYLIGEAADDFATCLDGAVKYDKTGDLKNALAQAMKDASACTYDNPIVLLSPACASFDQFKDFEERGDTFRTLVQEVTAQHVCETELGETVS